jgi:hypothetical protein
MTVPSGRETAIAREIGILIQDRIRLKIVADEHFRQAAESQASGKGANREIEQIEAILIERFHLLSASEWVEHYDPNTDKLSAWRAARYTSGRSLIESHDLVRPLGLATRIVEAEGPQAADEAEQAETDGSDTGEWPAPAATASPRFLVEESHGAFRVVDMARSGVVFRHQLQTFADGLASLLNADPADVMTIWTRMDLAIQFALIRSGFEASSRMVARIDEAQDEF